MCLLIMMRRVALLVTAVAFVVKASDLTERQNPSFVSVLPTKATDSPIIIVTTTATATPNVRTTTIAPAPQPTTTIATQPPQQSSDGNTGPLAIPSPTASSAARPTAAEAFVGPYFGGAPLSNPDIPIISIFLNLFLLGAIVNAVFFRLNARSSKRSPKDLVSGLIVFFCLVRVAACALRLVWIAASASTAIIWLATISDNAG